MRYVAGAWSTISELDWVRDYAKKKVELCPKTIGNKTFIAYTASVRTYNRNGSHVTSYH